MATPTLRSLQQHYGGAARIVGIARPYVADVLAGLPYPQAMVPFDPRSSDRRLHTWTVARKLRKMGVEVMVLLTNSLRSAVLATLSGARQRVGYTRRGRGPLLTDRLPPPRDRQGLTPISALDYYLQLSQCLGGDITDKRPELSTTPADEAAADEVWHHYRIGKRDRVVVFNTGGAYGSSKHWPSPYFSRLAQQIASAYGEHVLVLCGPAERADAAEIVRNANHPLVHSLSRFPPSIGLTKACVRRAASMVTTDSGPRHFAHPFRVPVLTLFGPTDPRWADTQHPYSIDLQHKVDCAPCSRRICPLGHHRCMVDLTPNTVLAAYHQLRQREVGRAA